MRVGKDDTRVQLFYLYDTMFVPWLVRINRSFLSFVFRIGKNSIVRETLFFLSAALTNTRENTRGREGIDRWNRKRWFDMLDETALNSSVQ